MAEIKGTLISLVMFIGLILPLVLLVGIDVINNQGFMKTTSEVSELVKKEGGVTSTVQTAVNRLEDRGYTIQFKNENGGNLYGFAGYGKSIKIEYQYTYHNVFGDKTLKTENQVFNLHRY